MQPHPNAPPPGLRVHTFLASRVVTSPCFLVRVRLVCAQAFAEYGVTSPQDIEELLFTDDVHEALAFITDGLTKDFEMDEKEMAVTRLAPASSRGQTILRFTLPARRLHSRSGPLS